MALKHYREQVAWQKAIDLVEAVYRISRRFPQNEQFGLINQLRRASVSVPCNIAEGQGRRLRKQFAMYLRVARGSVQEVETQLIIAERLGYVTSDELNPVRERAQEVSRLVSGLLRAIESG
ncbi:MAG: four helix bundle protein [Tepidisphaeraceae bacterium]|jgi:four helix bundle protein